FWDVVTGLKYVGYLKPKIRDIILESPSIAHYEKVNQLCKLPDDTMVKYCELTNAKLKETKALRDRFLGVTYCGYDAEEAYYDNMLPTYERYGNGVECPANVDLLKDICRELGTTDNLSGRFFWDVVTGLKYLGYLKPQIRDIILESPSIAYYERVNLFCKQPDDTMVKYCALTNAKLNETKNLYHRFTGYLEDATKQTKINLSQVLCIKRNFWVNVIDMHDDQDGFREFARNHTSVFASIVTRAEKVLGVKADTKCELGDKYPDPKYKS
ncbi:unnamed protein product, partial [Medioppia subpectinata]